MIKIKERVSTFVKDEQVQRTVLGLAAAVATIVVTQVIASNLTDLSKRGIDSLMARWHPALEEDVTAAKG